MSPPYEGGEALLRFPYQLALLTMKEKTARAKAVKEQFIKRAEHEAKEGKKTGDILADGVIVGLGLLTDGGSSKQ